MMRENVFQLNVQIPNVLHHACLFTKMFDAETLNQFLKIKKKKKTENIIQNTLMIYVTVARSGIDT